ncbi:MAG: energy transducer TonB [Alteromonadaceae bacterium]|nr:MAG: energy transducer TonB [Alteromonadaceae bacterium]
MIAIRLIASLVLAAGVTFGLLFSMHMLIKQNLEEPGEGKAYKIPDITMPDREITNVYDTAKPDKPDDPDEPPPELPEPEFENLELDNSISVSTTIDRAPRIGAIGAFSSDGDYLPIIKPAPKYPSRATAKGLEGYCTVEYTVTTTGETRDVVVVDCPQKIFARSSVKAAGKFKYKPKVIDGEPIEVPGVRNRFTFQMEK